MRRPGQGRKRLRVRAAVLLTLTRNVFLRASLRAGNEAGRGPSDPPSFVYSELRYWVNLKELTQFMYTLCTHDRKEIHFTGHGRVFDGMQPAITPYARHRTTCKHKHDRNHHRCNCPIWLYDPSKPRGKQRYSADTNDWAEAIRKAGEAQEQRAPPGRDNTQWLPPPRTRTAAD